MSNLLSNDADVYKNAKLESEMNHRREHMRLTDEFMTEKIELLRLGRTTLRKFLAFFHNSK